MSKPPLSTVLPNPHQGESNKAPSKALQVEQMFDRIAGKYDLLNNWISMGFHKQWKRLACKKLHLTPGNTALDVCTGTGDLIDYLLPLVGPQGSVCGLDFSENMLAIARQRHRSTPNISLVQGDALQLPYPDNSFDAAIISFGLRNVTHIPQALREMNRVLKPGGWMVNLDTAPNPFLPGMRFYFTKIMPLIGGVLARDGQAYQYLSNSTQSFLTPKELKTAFEQAGCANVTSETLMLGSVSLQAGQKPL